MLKPFPHWQPIWLHKLLEEPLVGLCIQLEDSGMMALIKFSFFAQIIGKFWSKPQLIKQCSQLLVKTLREPPTRAVILHSSIKGDQKINTTIIPLLSYQSVSYYILLCPLIPITKVRPKRRSSCPTTKKKNYTQKYQNILIFNIN